MNVFGKLKPGVTRERAEVALAPAWHNILAGDAKDLSPRTSPAFRQKYVQGKLEVRKASNGISSVRDDFRLPLYLLMGMVGLVLLIACANVANLLLARAASREKEIAIRVSLGATRGRLIRHLLAESAILSFGGGYWGAAFGLVRRPSSAPDTRRDAGRWDHRRSRWPHAGLCLRRFDPDGLAVRLRPRAQRQQAGSGGGAQPAGDGTLGGGHARFRKVLVVEQIAFSVLLLGTAGLFARSLFNLKTFNPGFRADQLVEFTIDPQLSGYEPIARSGSSTLCNRRCPHCPAWCNAGMAKEPLLTNSIDMSGYRMSGVETTEPKDAVLHQNFVGAGFFSHMGIALLTGREIQQSDTAQSSPVAVVNEAMVRKYAGGRNPLGMRIASRNRTFE